MANPLVEKVIARIARATILPETVAAAEALFTQSGGASYAAKSLASARLAAGLRRCAIFNPSILTGLSPEASATLARIAWRNADARFVNTIVIGGGRAFSGSPIVAEFVHGVTVVRVGGAALVFTAIFAANIAVKQITGHGIIDNAMALFDNPREAIV